MGTYDFHCEKCDKPYELEMRITEYDKLKPHLCPVCKTEGYRVFSCNIMFTGEKVQEAEYNPAFGKVVKNKYERSELAKRFNAIEIGSEDPNKIHKNFEKQREDKRKKAYEDD